MDGNQWGNFTVYVDIFILLRIIYVVQVIVVISMGGKAGEYPRKERIYTYISFLKTFKIQGRRSSKSIILLTGYSGGNK